MTFLEQLQTSKGGLLRLKTELYWYGGRGRDNNPGRACLLLDAAAATAAVIAARAHTASADPRALALLLIDGQPSWVWISEKDVEVMP